MSNYIGLDVALKTTSICIMSQNGNISLILFFQPYAVGGFAEGPFTVKIPFTELIGKWQTGNSIGKAIAHC